MKFEFGQRVICVNDNFMSYCRYPVKKGSIYTIHGFYQCACGSHQVTLVEIPFLISMQCKCHRTLFRRQSYYNWRFVPLQSLEMTEESPFYIDEVLFETKRIPEIQKVPLQEV